MLPMNTWEKELLDCHWSIRRRVTAYDVYDFGIRAGLVVEQAGGTFLWTRAPVFQDGTAGQPGLEALKVYSGVGQMRHGHEPRQEEGWLPQLHQFRRDEPFPVGFYWHGVISYDKLTVGYSIWFWWYSGCIPDFSCWASTLDGDFWQFKRCCWVVFERGDSKILHPDAVETFCGPEKAEVTGIDTRC
jgi:hypothetical protein